MRTATLAISALRQSVGRSVCPLVPLCDIWKFSKNFQTIFKKKFQKIFKKFSKNFKKISKKFQKKNSKNCQKKISKKKSKKFQFKTHLFATRGFQPCFCPFLYLPVIVCLFDDYSDIITLILLQLQLPKLKYNNKRE